jgi:hypothetical protein
MQVNTADYYSLQRCSLLAEVPRLDQGLMQEILVKTRFDSRNILMALFALSCLCCQSVVVECRLIDNIRPQSRRILAG